MSPEFDKDGRYILRFTTPEKDDADEMVEWAKNMMETIIQCNIIYGSVKVIITKGR